MESRDESKLINDDILLTETLSIQLLSYIFSFLNRTDFDRAGIVCRLFYNISHDESHVKKEKEFSLFCSKYASKRSTIIKLPENHFAIGSWDGTIKIWNYSEGKLVSTLSAYGTSTIMPRVLCLAYLGNNKIISSTFDMTLHIQNYKTGQDKQKINVPSHVKCIFQLSDNELALGFDDKTIRILSLETGLPIKELRGHQGFVLSIVKLSNEELASSSQDGTLCIWNYKNGELLKTLNEENSKFNWAYSVIDLGNDEVGSCHDDGFRIWNYKTGECLRAIALERRKLRNDIPAADQIHSINSEVKCVAAIKLSNDKVACGYGNGDVRVWNYRTGDCVQILRDYKKTILYTQKTPELSDQGPVLGRLRPGAT